MTAKGIKERISDTGVMMNNPLGYYKGGIAGA
jgi:hypothetical protein